MPKYFAKESPQLLFLLAAFVALGPLSTDMYLPALPALVDIFATDTALVQLTLSAYLIGFSFFHLVCGPLADRFGRKPVMFGGLIIFAAASIACAGSQTIEELILWRFVQGVGACVGPTLGRAMVRDMYGPQRAAKALAYMSAIMALAPVIAPLLGGWILLAWDWPVIFLVLAAYALSTMLLLQLRVPESLPEKQSLRPAAIWRNYRELIGNKQFRLNVLALSFLYGGVFAFVASSSFILIKFMKVPADRFGYWFMFVVFGYILGNLFTGRYSQHFSPARLKWVGAALACVASFTMAILCALEIYHPLSIVLPIALYTGAVGITMPQAMAAALAPFSHIAGTASALMGFAQMAAAALAGAVVSVFLSGEPMPLALTLIASSTLSLLLFLRLAFRAA